MEDPMSSVLPPRPPSSGPPPLPPQAPVTTLSDNLRVVASRGQADNARDLLAAGAGFEPDEEGRTALHLAAQQGHTDVCKVLTSHGCEVNTQDTMGYSPLLRASSHGVQDTVHMLLESGCDPDLQDEHGNAAIHEACWNGFSKTAEVLVNFHCNVCLTNRAGFTALHLAAQNGHNECSRVLLYAGCDANTKNNYGDTALHTAARYGHAGVARILISAKCLLSEQNKNGDTSLHIASALKRRKIAKILVESGLDTDLLNKQGETASDVAQRKDHPEIVIIISNFSKPKSKHASRRHLEGHGVTFKDEIELADGPVVCPEDEPPIKPEADAKEPQAKAEKQERRFFFFKKKKKDNKEKPSPATQTGAGQATNPQQGKQAPRLFPTPQQQAERQKAAVLGFFSQYVPRDGVQLYRDLAGNIKQGPIGYAPVCQCGPSLKRLESNINETHQSFHNHLDSSHHALNQRFHSLNTHVNRQGSHLRSSMREQLDGEHDRCHNRISERLHEERMTTEAMMGRNNEGMKEEIESWLHDKLASYGHCLDHHHDDTALPPRNLFSDFTTMGRLVRSRSDETLSVSDYSGKNRKKDFYASRQAAMQQIRGWELPGHGRTPVMDNNNRRKEHNNNHVSSSNKNILVSAVEVHNPPSHLRNPSASNAHKSSNDYLDHHHHPYPSSSQTPVLVDKALSPSTNSTTSPDLPTAAPRNFPPPHHHHHQAEHRLTPTTTPTTTNDLHHPERSRPHPRVSFSPDPYHQHQQHPHHQRQYGENPYHHSVAASPSAAVAVGPPKAVLKPGSQYNPDHYHHQPHHQQPHHHPHHSNLQGGGPPNAADPKSVEQEGSSKTPPTTQLNGRTDVSSEHSSGLTIDSGSQKSKHGSLRNQMKRYQDDYGIRYKRNESKSPEISREITHAMSHSSPPHPPIHPRPMPRSRSVDNTLEDPPSSLTDQQMSGYVTDSGIRPSIRVSNPTRQPYNSSREQQSPPPRSATRYRLPETSSGYKSQPPYNNRVQSPGGYNNRGPPHSILKGGSAKTINTAGADRNNQNDIAAHIGLTRYPNSTTDRNPQSVSMYGINSAGKVSPLVYNNETYARIEEFTHGRLDVPSKSDSNILSSSSGNDTPLLDCLQHDSFLSPSASPSPNYIHGNIIMNKEDSTCSSNQDSGYDSRANRVDAGGIRRNIGGGGGDNSTGTPSSSFSMERTSGITSNWSGSPINTSTDVIPHDVAKDFPSSNNQYNTRYPTNTHYEQEGNLQRTQPILTNAERESIMKNPATTVNNNVNSFNNRSGSVRDYSPFRQGDATRLHPLPQSQTYSSPNQQKKGMEEDRRIYDKVQNDARDSSGNRINTVSQNDNNFSNNARTGYSSGHSNNNAVNDYQPTSSYSVRNQTAYNYSSGDETYGDRNSIGQYNSHNGPQPSQISRDNNNGNNNNNNNNNKNQTQLYNKMSQRSFSPGPTPAYRRFQSPSSHNPNSPVQQQQQQQQPPPPPPPPSSTHTRTPSTHQGNPTHSGMNSTSTPQPTNTNNNQTNTMYSHNHQRPVISAIPASPATPNNRFESRNNNNPQSSQHQQQQQQQPPPPSSSSAAPDYFDAAQNKVQAHVEGWYQRKLMEAAQRLRENSDYSSPPYPSNTPAPTSGYSSHNAQLSPPDQLYTSPPSYQHVQSQLGYNRISANTNSNNNNNNNNNNNHNTARLPPYHSNSFQSKQPGHSFSPESHPHYNPEGFNSQQNSFPNSNDINTSSANINKNNNSNPSLNTKNVVNHNSFHNGGRVIVNSERTHNDSGAVPSSSRPPLPPYSAVTGAWNKSREPPPVYNTTINGSHVNGGVSVSGGPQDARFVRRGSAAGPMRYDPVHGSDV